MDTIRDILPRLFLSNGLYREFVAFIGGVCMLGMLNLLYAPSLIEIPNWNLLGDIERLSLFIATAYITGHILFAFSWLWFHIIIRRVPIKKDDLRDFFQRWGEFFNVKFGVKKITREDQRTLTHSMTEFVHNKEGLRVQYTNIVIRRTVARMLVASTLILLFVVFSNSSVTLPYSHPTASFIFCVLILFSLFEISIVKESQVFRKDVALLVRDQEEGTHIN